MADPMFNFAWAREKLHGFRKYEADATRVKEDEKRYREQPGYQPGEKQS